MALMALKDFETFYLRLTMAQVAERNNWLVLSDTRDCQQSCSYSFSISPEDVMTTRFTRISRSALALTLVSSLSAGAMVATAPAAMAASSGPGSVAFTGSSKDGSSAPGSSNGGNNNAGSTADGAQGSSNPVVKSSEGIEGFGIGTVLVGTALTVLLGVAIVNQLARLGLVDPNTLPKLPPLPRLGS